MPSHNGELSHQRNERKPIGHSLQSQQSQSTSSDAGGSESEGGSLPPPFPDEDPERMKHSKFTRCPSRAEGFSVKGALKDPKLKCHHCVNAHRVRKDIFTKCQ